MYCPNPGCPHTEKTGEPAEYRSGFTHCNDCESALVDAKPFDGKDSAGYEEFVAKRTARSRRTNVIVSAVVMGGTFAFYIASASRAPTSDNVGIIFVPLILVTMYGPAASLISGLVQVAMSKRSPVANGMRWLPQLRGLAKEVMVTQPLFFKICGILGLLLLALFTLRAGQEGLGVVFFPFWAWEYF